MNWESIVNLFPLIGITLYLRQNKSHSNVKTTKAIPRNYPNKEQKCCWQVEELKLMNNDGTKSLVKTNYPLSVGNKTKCSLNYPWHEEHQNFKSHPSDHSYYPSSHFKGPLDDLMSKIVGERSIPYIEDESEYNDLNNSSCDNNHVNESRIHHTNCELELKGLKESLSSYSISCLKQV